MEERDSAGAGWRRRRLKEGRRGGGTAWAVTKSLQSLSRVWKQRPEHVPTPTRIQQRRDRIQKSPQYDIQSALDFH